MPCRQVAGWAVGVHRWLPALVTHLLLAPPRLMPLAPVLWHTKSRTNTFNTFKCLLPSQRFSHLQTVEEPSAVLHRRLLLLAAGCSVAD